MLFLLVPLATAAVVAAAAATAPCEEEKKQQLIDQFKKFRRCGHTVRVAARYTEESAHRRGWTEQYEALVKEGYFLSFI